MSRDWTPREQHYFDKQSKYKMSKQKITCTFNGQEETISDPECEIAKKYPNMYFLCQNVLIRALTADKDCSMYELALITVIAADNTNVDMEKMMTGELIPERVKLMAKWYCGKLCDRFYYNEENNENLLNYILGGK